MVKEDLVEIEFTLNSSKIKLEVSYRLGTAKQVMIVKVEANHFDQFFNLNCQCERRGYTQS